MADGTYINPVEFGKMLATLDNIHTYILEVRSDVKTQNSRVYKLEEQAAELKKALETHTHDITPSQNMTIKDRALEHGVPGAVGGVTAMAVIYGLVELAKLLAGKI